MAAVMNFGVTIVDPPPSCSVGALDEPLAGTAPNRRVWALIEHPGPWGREAVMDAPWPTPDLGPRLQAATEAGDIRVVLARRHGRAGQVSDPGSSRSTTVILARCGPGGWAARTTVAGGAALLDLDWASLGTSEQSPASGANDTWTDAGPVWAVCTQGTRDACCARLGRPIAGAFDALDPEATWEISHSGGHRFAGVVIALPEGLVYGRVAPTDVTDLTTARAGGRVVRRLLRGAVHLNPMQQAGEAALREHLDDDRLSAFTPLGSDRDDGRRTTWRYVGPGGETSTWGVDVAQKAIADRPASCGKAPEPATAWVVTAPPECEQGGAGRTVR